MPFPRKYKCQIVDTRWITPTVLRIRFKPRRKFSFRAGQFVSVSVPEKPGSSTWVKRAYSLASSPEESQSRAYELCIRFQTNGAASEHLASLRQGATLEVHGPFGEFHYKAPEAGRSVCFIGSGTGVGPLRSMVLSQEFQETRPEKVLTILGARNEQDIVYPRLFESLGIETIHALSRPTETCKGFSGRVTDALQSLPTDFEWRNTDFYLCGGVKMTQEVEQILLAKGVDPKHIHREAFTPANVNKTEAVPSALNLLTLDFSKKAA